MLLEGLYFSDDLWHKFAQESLLDDHVLTERSQEGAQFRVFRTVSLASWALVGGSHEALRDQNEVVSLEIHLQDRAWRRL